MCSIHSTPQMMCYKYKSFEQAQYTKYHNNHVYYELINISSVLNHTVQAFLSVWGLQYSTSKKYYFKGNWRPLVSEIWKIPIVDIIVFSPCADSFLEACYSFGHWFRLIRTVDVAYRTRWKSVTDFQISLKISKLSRSWTGNLLICSQTSFPLHHKSDN